MGESLGELAALMPNRDAALCRELTKLHEEVLRGTLGELALSHAEREWRGEIVLVLGEQPAELEQGPSDEALRERARKLLASGASVRAVADELSESIARPRRELYSLVLSAKASPSEE